MADTEKNVSVQNTSDHAIFVRVSANALKSVERKDMRSAQNKTEDEQTKERTIEVAVGVEGAGSVAVKHGRKDGERHLREQSDASDVWSKTEWASFTEAGFRELSEQSKPINFGGNAGSMVYITVYWYETDGDDEKQKESEVVRMLCNNFPTWGTKFKFNGIDLDEVEAPPPPVIKEEIPEHVEVLPRSHRVYSLKGQDGKYVRIGSDGYVYQNSIDGKNAKWRCCEVFDDDRKRFYIKGATVNNYCGHWLTYKNKTKWIEVLPYTGQRARCTLHPAKGQDMHFLIKVSWYKDQVGWLASNSARNVVLVADKADAEIYEFVEQNE